MDNPFANEYKNQTGTTTGNENPVASSVETQNPFANEYKSQTGVTPQITQTPADVASASLKGKDANSMKYNGYCQQFVDDVLGTPNQNRAPSATAAFQNYAQQGKAMQGTQGIQPGDIIYFQDPKDPNGHVGFFSGKGQFISATEEDPSKPVKNHSIAGWQELTGQKILGYVKNPQSLPTIGGNYGQQ